MKGLITCVINRLQAEAPSEAVQKTVHVPQTMFEKSVAGSVSGSQKPFVLEAQFGNTASEHRSTHERNIRDMIMHVEHPPRHSTCHDDDD